jgi:Zn-dependent protease with chaperone function
VVDVMDWPETPEVFVANSPFFNAGAYGVRAPFIVLNSSVVKALGDDELYCVVAHEMGHIMSGHALYKTVLWVLLRVSLGVLPVAGLLVKPLMLALREWERKSELTADRAALLALQSEKENYELLMKIAGGEDLASMNLNDFLQQAWEYENQKGLLDGLFKLLNTVDETHPFPVIRLQELKTWADAGSYRAILSGDYPRRGSGGADAREDVREGYQYYKTELEESEDPILKAARTAGGAIGKATEGLRDALKDILKNG